jgi:hypothetical protein
LLYSVTLSKLSSFLFIGIFVIIQFQTLIIFSYTVIILTFITQSSQHPCSLTLNKKLTFSFWASWARVLSTFKIIAGSFYKLASWNPILFLSSGTISSLCIYSISFSCEDSFALIWDIRLVEWNIILIFFYFCV